MAEVYFRKPRFRELQNESKTIVDMHYHTKYSPDSIARPSLILKKARKLGIGLAVTDHNTIEGAREMWKHRKDVFIIPGIEVTDATCIHSLVYFYDFAELEDFYNRVIKPRLYKMPFFISKNLNYVLESAKDYNCVFGIPHPFAPGSATINNINWTDKMFNKVDLVEVINAFNLRSRNIYALELANKINKGMTGGSDGHSIGELGNAVTIAEGRTREEFLKSLLQGSSTIIGNESNLLKKAMQTFGKETTAFRNNIRTHNQLNRLRSFMHANNESFRTKLGKSRQSFSRFFFRNM